MSVSILFLPFRHFIDKYKAFIGSSVIRQRQIELRQSLKQFRIDSPIHKINVAPC